MERVERHESPILKRLFAAEVLHEINKSLVEAFRSEAGGGYIDRKKIALATVAKYFSELGVSLDNMADLHAGLFICHELYADPSIEFSMIPEYDQMCCKKYLLLVDKIAELNGINREELNLGMYELDLQIKSNSTLLGPSRVQ